MKIVIDIDDDHYKMIMHSDRNAIERFVSKEGMMYAIKNGVPINKIRDRIYYEMEHKYDDCDFDFICGMGTAIDIIEESLK